MYHISKDKRSIESSGWICDAVEKLLKTYVFEQLTVTLVCKEAKVGRATFYRHFDALEDVLQKKCDDAFNGLLPFLIGYRKDKQTETGFLKPFLNYWYQHSNIIVMIFHANQQAFFTDAFQLLLQNIQTNFGENINVADDRYINTLRVAMMTAMLEQWVDEGLMPGPDELAEAMHEKIQRLVRVNSFF